MSSTPSEDGFLDRVNRGTDSAGAELDKRYRHRLCRLVERELDRRLRSREDPEDVVQTVFRTYFRRAAQGEFRITHTADLWALLAKITRRKILKRAEYHRAERRTSDSEDVLPSALPDGRQPGPLDAAIAAELVHKTLQGLEPLAAEVFHLRLGGYTEREIAEQLGCARSTVQMKLQRIRDRLAKMEEVDSRQ
jgi:RNA polymerase sigma-70 factor (ECF subfamily)